MCPTTLTCFSFFFRTSSHSFTILPHRIHESSSRWLRLLEADELDTREDPLFLLDPFTDRKDLLSVSRSLQRNHTQTHKNKKKLHVLIMLLPRCCFCFLFYKSVLPTSLQRTSTECHRYSFSNIHL